MKKLKILFMKRIREWLIDIKESNISNARSAVIFSAVLAIAALMFLTGVPVAITVGNNEPSIIQLPKNEIIAWLLLIYVFYGYAVNLIKLIFLVKNIAITKRAGGISV